MATVLAPGTAVNEFYTVELVGDGTETNVYLASRGGVTHWLIQIESPAWHADVPGSRTERFEREGEHWLALPTSGTNMVNLASWVDRLELAFVGWRWTIFARGTGYLHQRKQVLQGQAPLGLDRLVFNDAGELILAQEELAGNSAYAFPPPEATGALTPASDVYSLAASLRAIVGDTAPQGVVQVLDKATAQDPVKRYPNANEFGEALAAVLPNPNRVKAPQPPRKVFRWARIGCVVAMLALVACCYLTVYATYQVVNSRQFQQEFQRAIQEQQRLQQQAK